MTPEQRNAAALRASIDEHGNRFKGKIDLGDKVRITRYMLGVMTESPCHDESVEGFLGIVCKVEARRWVSGYPKAAAYYVRMLEGPGAAKFLIVEGNDRHDDMELVEKGDGTCVPGVHYPFTEDELREQRWAAFVDKVATHDYRYEGYRNSATYLAWLYLNNDSWFYKEKLKLRRADGTINPNKVERAFRQRKLEVDDWAFECPIDVPAEFKGWRIPGLSVLVDVDWQEVADQFREKH